MGSNFKPAQQRLYESLMRLYPRKFQQHYATTMQQTFGDLLEAEKSQFGRSLIWARSLTDLPITAAKEHLTIRKDLIMNRNTKFLLAGALIAVVTVGLASFWAGNLHAHGAQGIERVTASQLADAMQQDHFYSSYGDAAVLFSGQIASVQTKANASLVTFRTGRSYAVVCQFPLSASFTSGQTIAVAAPAGSAERQTQGVLLHNCLVN